MTDMKIIIGENVVTGKPVVLDLDYAIEERMQVLGNSGSGKSHVVRCICEQANGKVQQIIISPKKEFVTLREKFDYVHVGTKTERSQPDIELNTRHAGQLALRILETGMDTIIEFSEAPKDRVKYVRNFIEGLMEAQEHLWHPVMIVIDEIDIWAPEKGHGEAESLSSIVDLAARGRDKGFFLVAATQKLPKFNKDVASELNIKFIGKVSLDNDQTRAAQELGIPTKEKTKLKNLGRPLFHFYAFGPGLSDDVIKMKSLPVQTTHVSGYKRNKMQKPIPTPAAIKKMISQFSDLPQEAEKELKTKLDLHTKITEQHKEIIQLKRQQLKQDPQAIERSYQKGVRDTEIKFKEQFRAVETYQKRLTVRVKEISDHSNKILLAATVIDSLDFKINQTNQGESRQVNEIVLETIETEQTKSYKDGEFGYAETKLGRCEESCLKALAQRGKPSSKLQVAAIAGYSYKSGGFNNSISKLKSFGFISSNGTELEITPEGLSHLGSYTPIESDSDSLLIFWKSKLGRCSSSILECVHKKYPDSISKDDVALETEYSVSSGGFNNGISKLNSLGLITRDNGNLKASMEMFPDE